MQQPAHPWRGVITALATPMHSGGAIDWGLLDRLVDSQLAAGIAGLVVNGSTSEAATLTAVERHALLRRVVARVQGRAKVIAGTGMSATRATQEEQRVAHELGADAALVVTPPYNRPNQRGLLLHYRAVHEAAPLPILLYNVPGRTGLDLSVKDACALAALPGVVGLKDANADLGRVLALRARLGPDFALLSGDDASAAAYVALGGDGLISVASNCVPKAMRALVAAAAAGERAKWTSALAQLGPLLRALACDSNPIPIKAALAEQQGKAAHYRLPLCPLSDEAREQLVAALLTAS